MRAEHVVELAPLFRRVLAEQPAERRGVFGLKLRLGLDFGLALPFGGGGDGVGQRSGRPCGLGGAAFVRSSDLRGTSFRVPMFGIGVKVVAEPLLMGVD